MSSLHRKSFTVKYKLNVMEWYHTNGNNAHATAIHFEIERSLVRRWLAKEKAMKKMKDKTKTKRVHYCIPKPMFPALDDEVYQYLCTERAAGRPVSNKQLKAKAMEIAPRLSDTFQASGTWLKQWKRRNGVSLWCATNDSQKVPADYKDVLHSFRSQIMQQQIKHSLTPAQMYNMDQTMCRFDMVPNRTNHSKGSKTVRITSTKATKKGFTVALCANGAGDKLAALIIFKEKGGKLGPRVSKDLTFPPNVKVTASTNGWMTSSLYHWWLENIFTRGNMAVRHLLLVDNYKSHMTEESKKIVEETCNSELIFIPAGCTPLVQPMDVSVNRPFKQRMRDLWVEWFATHTLRTVHGNPKQPSRQDVINWVSAAWDSIKSDTIKDSFLLCGITAAVDGSDNSKMFSHVPRVAQALEEDPSDASYDDTDASGEEVSGDDYEDFDSSDPLDSD